MKTLLTALFLLSISMLRSQTPISGVVNSYYRVVEVLPARGCVRVDNPAGLTANNRAMLIQMKGAAVNTTNSASFGTVTALNNAGNYEINIICSIRGDSVFFMQDILHTYTPTAKVQLVRIPLYASAVVTDTLRALPWDSASGRGGVLAISVEDDLILQAPVWAAGRGYRGGAYVLSSGTCSNFVPITGYVYNPTNTNPQNGAWKGEGIAEIPTTSSGGRAPNANGGGGGNNHNNGGAGGSNLSAGGMGGGNSGTAGCTGAYPGVSGMALTNDGGSKIYMGGGGGGGHANSTFVTGGGGSGGGIIFIQANNLVSNGHRIAANGAKGGNTIGDGAPGGGGGGTILMDVVNYTGNVRLEAVGGDGGNESDDNISGRCYGEGGGGSGGVIYFRNAAPSGTINVNGGVKGTKTMSVGCPSYVLGTAGAPGAIFTSYVYQQAVTITPCAVVLPVKLVSFRALLQGTAVYLKWEIADAELVDLFRVERRKYNESWKQISSLTVNHNRNHFDYNDPYLGDGTYQYRLVIKEKNGALYYSSIQTVSSGLGGEKPMVISPNPARTEITIHAAFTKGNHLTIIDASGRIVFQKDIDNAGSLLKHDIRHLIKGIYVVKVGRKWTKLVVE